MSIKNGVAGKQRWPGVFEDAVKLIRSDRCARLTTEHRPFQHRPPRHRSAFRAKARARFVAYLIGQQRAQSMPQRIGKSSVKIKIYGDSFFPAKEKAVHTSRTKPHEIRLPSFVSLSVAVRMAFSLLPD
jgi:hypothetical protein